jgi:hypothetical protein
MAWPMAHGPRKGGLANSTMSGESWLDCLQCAGREPSVVAAPAAAAGPANMKDEDRYHEEYEDADERGPLDGCPEVLLLFR